MRWRTHTRLALAVCVWHAARVHQIAVQCAREARSHSPFTVCPLLMSCLYCVCMRWLLYLAVRGSPSGHAFRGGVRASVPVPMRGDEAGGTRGELLAEWRIPVTAEPAAPRAGEPPTSHDPSPSSARISSAASSAYVTVAKQHTQSTRSKSVNSENGCSNSGL